MPNLNDVLAVILGGGRGSRLYPLTKLCSKPAVPIAGKYRLIDKNARLGADVVIRPFPREAEMATENWVIQDGIVVIPKDAILPDGTRVEPK